MNTNTIKQGDIINLNGGQFKVLSLCNDEIKVQRTTEPKIISSGELEGDCIKLSGWNSAKKYEAVN